MRRKWRRALATLTILTAALALAACSGDEDGEGEGTADFVSTDLDDFSFRSLDVVYDLTRAEDGTSRMRVTETFVAEFPDYDQNRGMRRLLPDTYNGQPLFPELVSITDADGTPRDAETESDDGVYAMTSRADDYVHGTQTYVFTYDLENVTWSFADTDADEFYWDVNGLDWAQPFGRVSATLRLDADLAAALTGQAACYVGAAGATDPCAVTVDGGTVTASTEGLAPYRTMTIAVGFEPGTFTPFDSRYLASGWSWLQLGGILVVVGGFVWAVVVRRTTLRDAPGRPTIIAEYDPPPLDALESAVFLGRTDKAIPAEVLEQAVVGSIRLEETGRGWFGKATLRAVLVDPTLADEDGRMLLQGLFGDDARPGAEYVFAGNDTAFASVSQSILADAGKVLTGRGLYRPVPARARLLPGAVVGAGAAIAVLGGVLALGSGADGLPAVLLVILAALAFIAVFFVLAHRPRSALGAELRDHLAGLKVFIEWAEADRIRMLQSPSGAERIDTGDARQLLRIYEPLLPYAVVFGQEKEWAKRLAVLYDEASVAPVWWYGAGAFSAASFSSGISTLSASAASSSSTSGGSSGGGSAGGGGGGGGGGGV
ncbi:DUF2207 domain-containing protein [Microbacterium sp. GXF7504]